MRWDTPIGLIRSPWVEAFSDFARHIRSRAIVAAPYISAGPLNQLASEFNSGRTPDIEVITNLEPDSLLHGSVDIEAIAAFGRVIPTVTVRHLPSLHGKAYVAEDTLAIITSGNLTEASLYRNYE